MFVDLPKPKRSMCSAKRSFPTLNPSLIAPTSDEFCRICFTVSSPNRFQSCITRPKTVITPIWQSINSEGSASPSSKAEAAVTILNVDPGSYVWLTERLIHDCGLYFAYSFGLKVG